MSKTTVISARVSTDIADIIKRACETHNLSTSKYLTKIIESPYTPSQNQNSGVLIVNKENEMPSEIKTLLGAVGGIGVGTIVYNILKMYLPEDKFSEEQRENISLLCAVASGIGGLIAIDRLLNKK